MAQIRTQTEMFPLVENWQKSGLTQKEFSQKHELPLHILPYWVARYRKGQPSVSPSRPQSPGFIRLSSPVDSVPAATRVPADLSAVSSAAAVDTTTVVELPSGVVVRFSSLLPVEYIKELLTGLLV
jgi:hypothetical protein